MSGNISFREFLESEKPEVRAEADREFRRLLQQVEDQRMIREVVEMSSANPAKTGIEQDDLARLGRRAETALRTLRRFVEQVGGELEIVVSLPNLPPIRLDQASDAPARTDDSPVPTEV